MKNTLFVLLCGCFCMLTSVSIQAQESPVKKDTTHLVDEDEGPAVFKFEPDFINQNEKRKAEIATAKSIIDTLQISERRRLKLIRDLYKNGISKRLQKALLVENNYEDIED